MKKRILHTIELLFSFGLVLSLLAATPAFAAPAEAPLAPSLLADDPPPPCNPDFKGCCTLTAFIANKQQPCGGTTITTPSSGTTAAPAAPHDTTPKTGKGCPSTQAPNGEWPEGTIHSNKTLICQNRKWVPIYCPNGGTGCTGQGQAGQAPPKLDKAPQTSCWSCNTKAKAASFDAAVWAAFYIIRQFTEIGQPVITLQYVAKLEACHTVPAVRAIAAQAQEELTKYQNMRTWGYISGSSGGYSGGYGYGGGGGNRNR